MKKKKKDASPFAPIEEAVAAFRDGRMIIVCDDEDRENEGDLTIAAEKVTPDVVNFMAKEGRGLICMPMTESRLEELDIPQMVPQNTARFETAFCVSVRGPWPPIFPCLAPAARVRLPAVTASRPDPPCTPAASRSACSALRSSFETVMILFPFQEGSFVL